MKRASTNLKNIGFALVAVMILWASIANAAGGRGVRFMNLSFKEATHQAEHRRMAMFMFIGSNTCMQSKRMEDVFKLKDVSFLYNKHFFCNRYNTDNLLGLFKASNFWGVKHYPTYLFFTADGKLLYKEEGYKTMAETIAMAEKAQSMIDEYNATKSSSKGKGDNVDSQGNSLPEAENVETESK